MGLLGSILTRSRQVRIAHKSIENRSKIDPKLVPNRSIGRSWWLGEAFSSDLSSIWGRLGSILSILDRSGVDLESIWGRSGVDLGRSGSILGHLGVDLGRSGVDVGGSGSISIDSEGEHADVEQTSYVIYDVKWLSAGSRIDKNPSKRALAGDLRSTLVDLGRSKRPFREI